MSKAKEDSLGDRIKGFYEDRSRVYLPRRANIIIRVDGRAFHTLTRGFRSPYDEEFMSWMDQTCIGLCEEVAGAKFGYVQSDEISVWVTDYDKIGTEAWFDNNLQKMVSVAASIATAAFNALNEGRCRIATFDARAFVVPSLEEVVNYFIWRQKDATRNSISMAAFSQFSAKEMHGKGSDELQEMLFQQKSINWNDYPAGFKRGRSAIKVKEVGDLHWKDPGGQDHIEKDVERHVWKIDEPPVFTADRNYIRSRAPVWTTSQT